MRYLPAILCLLIAGSSWAEPLPVVVSSRSPHLGHPPHLMRYMAKVQPNEHNRQICFEWIAQKASGKGCEPIDGLNAPATFWRDITFRAPGIYLVAAFVERDDNHTLMSNVDQVRVLGIGEEFEDGSDTTNP